MNSSLNVAKLSWGRTKDILTINWQIFAQVRLQLRFAFIIMSIICLAIHTGIDCSQMMECDCVL